MQLGFPLPHIMRLKATMQPWEASVTGADQTRMVKRADALGYDMVSVEPKPVQQPHPPIWIGGDSDAALRRAARFASGWHPFLTKDEDIPARLEYIKSQPAYDGRPFEVMRNLAGRRIGEGHVVRDDPSGARPGMSAWEIIDQLGRLKELGVTISSVPIPSVDGPEAYMEYAQWVIEEVKPKA